MHSELPSLLPDLCPQFSQQKGKQGKATFEDLSAWHWPRCSQEPETDLPETKCCMFGTGSGGKAIKPWDQWHILLENHFCGNCFMYHTCNTPGWGSHLGGQCSRKTDSHSFQYTFTNRPLLYSEMVSEHLGCSDAVWYSCHLIPRSTHSACVPVPQNQFESVKPVRLPWQLSQG